jgi:hypothetical protein
VVVLFFRSVFDCSGGFYFTDFVKFVTSLFYLVSFMCFFGLFFSFIIKKRERERGGGGIGRERDWERGGIGREGIGGEKGEKRMRENMLLLNRNFNAQFEDSCANAYKETNENWRCALADNVIPCIF